MSENDYYKILGIEKNADAKQLKDAYRELAFQYHPDKNKGNPDAAEKMKKINEAYAVLSNSEKKQEYDSMRMRFGDSAYGKFRNEYSEQDIFSGSDINHIFDEMAKAFGFRGVDEIFNEFYGKGYKTFEFKQPGFFAAGFIFSNFFGNRQSKTGNIPLLNQVSKLSGFLIKKLSGIEIPANGTDIKEIIHLSPGQAKKGGPYAYFLKKQSKKIH